MKSFILTFTLFSLLFHHPFYSYIIPDPISPLIFNKPFNFLLGNQMSFRFTFDSSTNKPPLIFNQYFGIGFPNLLSSISNLFYLPIFESLITPKYSCALSLTVGTVTTSISVTCFFVVWPPSRNVEWLTFGFFHSLDLFFSFHTTLQK